MLIVLVIAVGSIMLATHRLVLSSAAAEIARLEARGDVDSAAAVIGSLALGGDHGVRAYRSTAGPVHCVVLRAAPLGGAFSAFEVAGRGCAAVSVVDR